MNKTKKYGRGGKPLFIRLGRPEREAWDAIKAHVEATLGQRVSHSLLIGALMERYQSIVGQKAIAGP